MMAYPFTGIVVFALFSVCALLMYARLVWLDNQED